ncbi:MAG: hypothetical protein COS41_03570 [Elusimicrobia bacterium CG03_land_8_20_14_0_80_50_18]|nr:MAG: hypothetical protein COS41_03570 [Elusimicrobia bacterium CG03_land_8_20_14_0_80_50_18]PIX14778.1 MAG: hypothetical protein COZ72_05255 [Elusimicrobia bacterium CG_4_8_14_3_um_filter_50_9]
MITVHENTTLVGVSELRGKIEKILAKAQKGLVIIEKRHKPMAVLTSQEEYKKIQDYLEIAEDIVLGFIARQRYSESSDRDYIDIEKLLK